MTISYTIEKSDLKKYFRDYQKYSPAVKRMNYVTYIFILLFSVYYTAKGTYEYIESVIYVFVYQFIILFILIKGIQFILTKISNWISFSKLNKSGTLGEHTITISDESVSEISPMTERKDRWQAINNVIKERRHIYIICDQGAYIVPLRAFASETLAEDFFNTASKYLLNAKTAA